MKKKTRKKVYIVHLFGSTEAHFLYYLRYQNASLNLMLTVSENLKILTVSENLNFIFKIVGSNNSRRSAKVQK